MKYSILVIISFLLAASMADATENTMPVAEGTNSTVTENTDHAPVKPRVKANGFKKKREYRQITDRSR